MCTPWIAKISVKKHPFFTENFAILRKRGDIFNLEASRPKLQYSNELYIDLLLFIDHIRHKLEI